MRGLKFIFTILVLFKTSNVFSQPNKLDSSFSSDGIQTTFFGKSPSIINDIALQPNGKIVAVGRTNTGEFDKIAIVLYNYDGSEDSSFGEDGKVITSVGKKNDVANSVVIQPDGKIVVAGYTFNGLDNDILLLRYNNDGSLDKRFGKNGIVTTAVGFIVDLNDKANSVALQSDGKIVVGGTASGYFCLIRYKKDGSQDESFNYDGIVSIPVGILDNDGRDIAVQSDGKILILGTSFVDWNWDFCVLRFSENGLLDTTFGKNGIAVIELENGNSVNEEPNSIALQTDGKIILGGHSAGNYLLIRLLMNGDLDKTFAEEGLSNVVWGYAKSIAIQTDGKIIAVGKDYEYNNYSYGFSWARLKSDGTADCSKFTEITSKDDEANSVVIQPDGKILLAGHSNLNFCLVRYMGDSTDPKVDIYKPSKAFFIYPNPLKDKFTLDYTLEDNDFVTIELWDMQGRKIVTYLNNEKQFAGNYYYSLSLPESLINGNYIVNFSSKNFQKKIRIIKI
jgi:uncharacterized delta-60 repeat protein